MIRSTGRAEITELMDTFRRENPNVRVAILAKPDGTLIDPDPGGWRSGFADSLAAISAAMVSLSEQTMNRIGEGGVRRVLVQADLGTMVVFPLERAAALAVMFNGLPDPDSLETCHVLTRKLRRVLMHDILA